MRFFLRCVLVNLFTTFIRADVKVESNGVGLRQHSLDGTISNQHLLFQADVSTELACAAACMKYACCVAFSTSPKGPSSKKMTCRGHDSKAFLQTSTVAIPGSQTYLTKIKLPESSWLERPCTTDSDCPPTVANVTCFPSAGQCLCQPGYYYSHCRDKCVPDCALADLTTMFLKYPDRRIYLTNIDTITGCLTLEHCLQLCLRNSQCRTIDKYYTEPNCYLASVTVLTPGMDFRAGNYDHCQRTCL